MQPQPVAVAADLAAVHCCCRHEHQFYHRWRSSRRHQGRWDKADSLPWTSLRAGDGQCVAGSDSGPK